MNSLPSVQTHREAVTSGDPSTPVKQTSGESVRVGQRDLTTATILDAAEKLFAEHGYAAVSVREIGNEAGVSHALVHRYLGAKRDVYRAVMFRHQDTIRTAIGDATTLEDAIAKGMRNSLTEHRAYFRLVVLSSLQGLPYARTLGRAPAVDRLIELADAEVRRFAPSEAPGLPPRVVVAGVVTLLMGWCALEPWILPASGLEALDEATMANAVTGVALQIATLLKPMPQHAELEAEAATDSRPPVEHGRRQATTESILEAAETLLAQKGYAAVSVRDIGARAGVSHALVHRYLGSKQDIYQAVLRRNEEAVVQAATGKDDLIDAIRAMAREGLRERRQYMCIIAQSAGQGVPFETATADFSATRRLIELAEARCAPELGQESLLTPRRVIAAIVSLYLGWIASWPWIGEAAGLAKLDEAVTDEYLERIIVGLVDRLLPPYEDERPAQSSATDDNHTGMIQA